ncbi:MAG: RdgB/HAM1 family non-canonical purine NTP pyrophosphatase [Gaiellales bacterium]|nr:MAG: RdgB/HAM1 family non-canonical purine NTP pyrophosphatase [Gaiellales bacterium]
MAELPSRIILASGNPNKAREFEAIMAGIHVEPLPAGLTLPPETGDTFEENARLKAQAVHEQLAARSPGEAPWVMADDSGIEVQALGGAPGIYSARYAGEGATDADNNGKLLAELAGADDRSARFVCVLVAVAPDGGELVSEGIFEGSIAHEPGAAGGFGYDPLFIPADYSLKVSELPAEEKNRISHRARAALGMLDKLRGG